MRGHLCLNTQGLLFCHSDSVLWKAEEAQKAAEVSPIYLPLLHRGWKERLEMTMKYGPGSEGEREQGLKRDS